MHSFFLVVFVIGFLVLLGLAYALGYPLVALSRLGALELVLLSLATFRLTEILTEQKVAACFRSLFCTREQVTRSDGTVEDIEVPSGTGLRRIAGELVLCPWCMSVWIGALLTFLLILAPVPGRVALVVFSAAGGGMLFQLLAKLMDRTQSSLAEETGAPVVARRALDRAA